MGFRFIRGIEGLPYGLQGLLTYLLSPPDPPGIGFGVWGFRILGFKVGNTDYNHSGSS